MSEIECINLLAFIQFIVAFDFGLYYFDDKHTLTQIYRRYQLDLRSSTEEILTRANGKIKATLKSENEKCILKSRVFSLMFRKTSFKTPEILIKTRA